MNTPEKSKYLVTTAGATLHKSRESTRGQIWSAAHWFHEFFVQVEIKTIV